MLVFGSVEQRASPQTANCAVVKLSAFCHIGVLFRGVIAEEVGKRVPCAMLFKLSL